MKRSLIALSLLALAGSAHAAAPTYRTCAPFYYVEDANTFANMNLTQAQRDASQLVPLPQYDCPGDSSCATFAWVLLYPTTGQDAASRGCGKVPGFTSSPSKSGGPFGFQP